MKLSAVPIWMWIVLALLVAGFFYLRNKYKAESDKSRAMAERLFTNERTTISASEIIAKAKV